MANANLLMVSPAIWEPKFRKLSSDAKALHYYLVSCQSRNSEGLFRCPVFVMAGDTGLSAEVTLQALAELEQAGYVEYDHEHEIGLDRLALKFNPLRIGKNKKGESQPDNRIRGAVKAVAGTGDSPLFAKFIQLAETFSPPLAEAIWEAYPSYIASPLQAPRESLGSPEMRRDEQRGEERSREEETHSLQSQDGQAHGSLERFQKRARARGFGSEGVSA